MGVQQNGICSEESYPYTSGGGVTGTCKKTCTPIVTVTSHTDVPSKDETSLKAAVSQQTVSVAIEADKSAFQLYSGGVLDNPACGTQLDHGVLVVGYGTDDGKDYWKVITHGAQVGERRAISGWCATRTNAASHRSPPIQQVPRLVDQRHHPHHRLLAATTRIQREVAALTRSIFRFREYKVQCALHSALLVSFAPRMCQKVSQPTLHVLCKTQAPRRSTAP